jgi:hypothetical protein
METVSLQELIKDVAVQVRDLYAGSTTAASAGVNTFVDTTLGNAGNGQLDNQFAGSQVVFEEPAYTAGGNINPGPHVVTLYAVSGSVFTVTPAIRSSGVVASGLNYFMVRGGGRGNPYRVYVAAIRYALDELNFYTKYLDGTGLVTAANVYDYVLDAPAAGVYKVELAKAGYTTLQLLPRDWSLRPNRTLHLNNANINVGFGYNLQVWAVSDSSTVSDTGLATTYTVPRSAVVDSAVEYIQRSSTRAADNQRASLRQQERLRFNRFSPPANLRFFP